MYVWVILDITSSQVDKPFLYLLPNELVGQVDIGTALNVPFGNGNKLKTAYIIGLDKEISENDKRLNNKNINELKLKYVDSIADKKLEISKKALNLAVWLKDRYGSTLSSAINTVMVSKERVRARKKREKKTISSCEDFILNSEQKSVVDGIFEYSKNSLLKNETPISLIYGVTGSGKTNVYIELIRRVVNNGQQAVLLIPEISLTMQNIRRFEKSFGDRATFIHSKLSKGERYERIQKARNREIDIMIGPRTALFTPFSNIGIIIIDEEHENSYNSDRSPKYNAKEVAIKIADMNNALIVLGSATPSVESFYRALNNEYALFEIKNRYGTAKPPKIHIVDMKRELVSGNRDIFSRDLLRLIDNRLRKNEQIMLFLNRRGYFGFNACRACGEVIKCPHCDVSLSLHFDEKLRCHYCGYEVPAYHNCPSCNSGYIGSMNAGTQQVQEQIHRYFPKARALRMDADTTSRKYDTDKILDSFAGGDAEILIGTQMIVKGHDFPRVTLMGILLADLALNISSYTASERCFQILMQASGRVGRGNSLGEVVLQTYRPEHFCIQMAKNGDYRGFYEEEINYRRLMNYPPFANFMLIVLQCLDEEHLVRATDFMKQFILSEAKKYNIFVIGPSIPPISKVNDLYRRFIYVKHRDFDRVIFLRNRIMAYAEINRGYDNIDIQFEYRPI